MKDLYKWLLAENEFMSELTEGNIRNVSVVCELAGVLLFMISMFLCNSPYDSESRLLQAVLLVIASVAVTPIIADIYLNKE